MIPTPVTIQFSRGEALYTLSTRISSLVRKGHSETLFTSCGHVIPMDEIRSINGIVF